MSSDDRQRSQRRRRRRRAHRPGPSSRHTGCSLSSTPQPGQEGRDLLVGHRVGSREQWLAGTTKLLEAEKEPTRRSDERARQRQQLPWVRMDEDHDFDTEAGPASLVDLFGGRTQLLIHHFIFPGRPSCALITDGLDASTVHRAASGRRRARRRSGRSTHPHARGSRPHRAGDQAASGCTESFTTGSQAACACGGEVAGEPSRWPTRPCRTDPFVTARRAGDRHRHRSTADIGCVVPPSTRSPIA
jgi:uncharacterized protein DUF899